jgi:hypothetical protein
MTRTRRCRGADVSGPHHPLGWKAIDCSGDAWPLLWQADSAGAVPGNDVASGTPPIQQTLSLSFAIAMVTYLGAAMALLWGDGVR